MADTENPYVPPSSADAELPVPVGLFRIVVYLFGSIGFGIVCWGFFLALFFGDSTELWPGFACGIVATAGSLAVAYWLSRSRLATGTLILHYCLLDFALFVAFVAYMLYWRIYLHSPDAWLQCHGVIPS